jgi:23S rRNA-/tRNA-specific pseudouridylate synthase
MAVVGGESPPEGEISVPLLKDGQKNFVRAAAPSEGGYEALTRFRRIQANGKYSLLEVELVTGRPHQARVHLASIGRPIIGDGKYGRKTGNHEDRLLLHAASLSFPDDPELPAGVRGLVAVSRTPSLFFTITAPS